PDNVNFTTIPKPQNAFILYRKNYAAKHKSLGDHKDWKILSKEASVAWKNESDKVKNYYKMLTKLAREKHDKKSNTLGNQLPKDCKNDNSNSSSSAIFLPCSISCDNALPINYDNNIINKTNAILQSARFNDLNGKNLLEGFQQYLQTEQTDAQLYENCLDLLDFLLYKFYEYAISIQIRLTNFALNLRSYVSNVNDDKGVYEDISEDISCVAKIRGWTR
ncbi:12593_t:CDS:2, partial [Entrophospora sp. SA101]